MATNETPGEGISVRPQREAHNAGQAILPALPRRVYCLECDALLDSMDGRPYCRECLEARRQRQDAILCACAALAPRQAAKMPS